MSADPQAQPFGILVVCTGNICRSPFAELALKTALRHIGTVLGHPGWDDQVRVSGAGTIAMVGRPIEPPMAELLVRYGVEATDRDVARQLERELIAESDLVLGLSREHRRDIVTRLPSASRRVFALNEFARLLADAVDAGGFRLASETSGAQAMALAVDAAAMRRGFALAPDDLSVDDVVDPYGRGPEVYEMSAGRIVEIVAGIERSLLTAAGVRT